MNSVKEKSLYISVIVPVYNTEKYLRKCIRSIINQTYRNLDIILVDDGSTDASGKICDEAAENDSRVRVIHKENAGLVSARRSGVSIAEGEYITYVDSDDYIEADTYERIINSLAHSDVDIIAYGLVEDYGDHLVPKKNQFEPGTYDKTELVNRVYPKMLSYGSFFEFGILPNLVVKLFRRDFLSDVFIKVSDNVSVGEDADATYQLLLQATSMQIIDVNPYHYCKRNDSMMFHLVEPESLQNLENDLREAFGKTPHYKTLMKQLEQYMTFVSLLKNPKVILKDDFEMTTSRVALYGAGGFGQAIHAAYSQNIELWVDQDYVRYVSLGYEVESVESLKEKSSIYDIIFVAILNIDVCKAVKQSLLAAGICKPILYYDGKNDHDILNCEK